jgi:hypothetical protein
MIKQKLQELRASGVAPTVLRIAAIDKDCEVITIDASLLRLNHDSHRIKAQLEDNPLWESLKHDPTSEEAQDHIADLVESTNPNFGELQASVISRGQEEHGVITHDGRLINGNTRAVVLRKLGGTKSNMSVAVLPASTNDKELLLIENRFQTQREIKGEYGATNFLLTINDLHKKAKMSYEDVADKMNLNVKVKDRYKRIEDYLATLDLVRHMQKISNERLPLRWFDDNGVSLEALLGTLGNYQRKQADDSKAAEEYLKSQVIAWASGVKEVHKVRKIDEDFLEDWGLPVMEGDQDYQNARFVMDILKTAPATSSKPGDKLRPASAGAATLNSQALLDLLTRQSKSEEIVDNGIKVTIERAGIKEFVRDALLVGIKDKSGTQTAATRLDQPAQTIKEATQKLQLAVDQLQRIYGDPQFTNERKNKISQAIRLLHKRLKEAEHSMTEYGITLK